MAHIVKIYKKDSGKAPVLEYIENLSDGQQARIHRYVDLVRDYGKNAVGDNIKRLTGAKYNKLWEIRVNMNGHLRVIFFFYQDEEIVLLHGFTKQGNHTPTKELEKALTYMDDYIN